MKYSWAKASSAVILVSGLKVSILSKRSSAVDSILKIYFKMKSDLLFLLSFHILTKLPCKLFLGHHIGVVRQIFMSRPLSLGGDSAFLTNHLKLIRSFLSL